jgi:rod shape-determining protein MreC
MLWDKIQQLKELLSLIFCVGFSISSLVWNSNLVVRTVASSQTVTDAVSSSVDTAGGLFKNIIQRFQSNEELRKERDSYAKLVDEYRVYYHDIETLQAENSALRKELDFQLRTNYPVVKAEILSFRLNSIYRTIVINKGKKDKIYPLMPVIASALSNEGQIIPALVGKVIASNQNSAIIQPLINSNFSMGVQIEGGNFWAILSGNSGRGTYAILNYLDPGVILNNRIFSQIGPSNISDVSELEKYLISGKEVFSSAGGGVFPPRIPVGVIVDEGPRDGAFKSAFVKPYIKFEELKYVSVIIKFPDKWVEDWPEEKSVNIENPYYGELNFPGEEPDSKNSTNKNPKDQPKKAPMNNTPIPKLDVKPSQKSNNIPKSKLSETESIKNEEKKEPSGQSEAEP